MSAGKGPRPFSALAQRPIDFAKVLETVKSERCGAVDLFIGAVRNHHEGKKVEAVTYEAFAPLAVKTLEEIRMKAESDHGARVSIAHRIGTLQVGEISLCVAAAAPHRVEAYNACRQAVEQIKARLPVWKKEHYADGGSAWLEGCALR